MEKFMWNYRIFLILLSIFFNINIFSREAVRIKDIAIIQGLRDNQLMGFGLVTGIAGKGDSKTFRLTHKMIMNLANNYGFEITEDDIRSKNIAAVIVIATVGSFARNGDKLDVTVSSIGDAKSLAGGTLLQTPLRAADGNIYAVAHGTIINGTKTETIATIPQGAIVERDVVSNFVNGDKINIILRNPDFTTANAVREAILTINPSLQVKTIDPGLIEITLTEEEMNNPVEFISKLEVLQVTPDYVATIVIDKKSGMIVAGADIVIQDAVVSIPQVQVKVTSNKERKTNFEIKGSTIGELVNILNEVGLTIEEIISLIEALHKANAISAKIIIL
ncbi:MAG TPA: flagellar basal body P-ring protein FlgI [Spirochaetota bacterium]|nr:flagellar basal body P-ring protein FlgI [Spirochaetota bacterium]